MTRFLISSIVALAHACLAVSTTANDPQTISLEEFEQLHAMFKTQPGESRFWELPWMIQLDEACKKGAAEGMPIFVWCGAGGAPVGVC
jgi:hypothetical protein